MSKFPHIDQAIARGRIELKSRFRPKNASWNPGGKIHGDREVWIDGAHWLNAIMSQHGRHGSRHTLEYADGGELVENPGEKRPRTVTIDSRKYRQRNAARGVTAPDQWTAITDKVLELLAADRLKSPDLRAARREEQAAAYRAGRDAEATERARMLEGVFSLRDRTDLTRQERDGLAYLYKEAFADAMPFPEGRSQ